MTDRPRTVGFSQEPALPGDISSLCAEFTSSWEAALKGGGEPPRIDPFLTRVPQAERSVLQRELTEIHQTFCQRASPDAVWQGGTIDQKADTPAPECLATIDSVRAEKNDSPSSDPTATVEHVSQSPSRGESPDGPGLPNAAFSLDEGSAATTKPTHAHVPGYEIVGELGRGGMGVVYKARQIGLNRWVALKMVLAAAHASHHQLERFLTEAQAVADLQHPNIVQIYEKGKHEGLPYFSLEFVGGGSLDAKVHRKAQPPRDAAHLVETLAEAMQYAHDHGIIHRDLKPANILLTVDGIPKITDFGLAKRLSEDSSHTKSGTLMGTPNYMAPEQARGQVQQVGPLADVYTLGAILYELLTGRPPFQAATVLETIKQVTNEEPVPPSRLQPHVPRDLETICLKCLQKDIVKRYGSAQLLADDLRRFLSDEPILARPVSNWERLTRWCRRNPRVASLVGTVALLLIVVACGSLAFAYRLSQEMERTEEQRKIADRNAALEKEARQEEKEARQDADRKAEEAKKSQEFAFEQAQVGLETVLNVVTTMNQKMRPIAELGPLRKELLQDALKRLEIIPKGAVAFGKVDRTTGITLQQMGKIYEQMGDTQNQTQVIEKSLEIFARLMAEQPEEDLNRYNATISHDALGEIGRENWADPSKIAFHFNRSLEMRKELVANKQSPKPEMSLRQHALAIAFQNWAVLALELGDPVKALEYAKDYLKQSQTALAADPKNEYARRELISSAYVLIGKASTRIPDSNDGPRYLRNSLLLRQEWIKAIPVDDYGKQELARSLDAMGDLETELGHYADAQDFYQRSLVIFQELQKKAPYVPEFQWFRANVDYHLGTVYRLQNNEKAAHEHFSSCTETREKLLNDDKTNAQRKVELMLVYARLGRHAEAAKMAQEIIEFAPRHPGKLFSAACGLAICSSAVVTDGPSAKADAKALKRKYEHQAIDTIRQALASGYKDVQALKRCPDLFSLQSLNDYKQLSSEIVQRQHPNG